MIDRRFMERAIELAQKGKGWTNPNPLVGAVIVKEGRIIGEGYHSRFGAPHAERNAIASLTDTAEGADLYITLEPCCHQGKTPPCTDAILEHRIARVIIGSRDPNPKVAGKGSAVLRKAGICLEEGFMKEDCDRLNRVFFHYITKKRPYVVMKYAMTADGKIASRSGASKWITGEEARARVQEMRWTYMGIMVGIGTILSDDPLLTVREKGRRNPVRIICDSRLRIPENCRICKTARKYPTVVVCAMDETKTDFLEKRKRLQEVGLHVISVPGEQEQVDLRRLMKLFGCGAIQAIGEVDSILLEGGAILNDKALQVGILQEVKAFIAPKIFGGSGRTPVEGTGVQLPSEARQLRLDKITQIGGDLLLEYLVKGVDERCLRE